MAIITNTKLKLDRFSDTIKAAADKIDWKPLLKAIRLDVIAETRTNFDRGGGPDGKTWAPLKYPRPGSKGGDLPLRDFGVLAASVTSPGSPGNIDDQGEKRIEWGTNLDYARIHAIGGIITPKIAKFLAIPATRDAQRTGSPRNWPDGSLVFEWKRNGGVAKDLKGEIQYYFARSVTIPARPYLGIADDKGKEYAEWAADHAAEEVAKSIAGAGA